MTANNFKHQSTAQLHDHLTLQEIADMMNVTRERIRQIEAKALRKVAVKLRSKDLTGEYFLRD